LAQFHDEMRKYEHDLEKMYKHMINFYVYKGDLVYSALTLAFTFGTRRLGKEAVIRNIRVATNKDAFFRDIYEKHCKPVLDSNGTIMNEYVRMDESSVYMYYNGVCIAKIALIIFS
jgi:hypothetical protein